LAGSMVACSGYGRAGCSACCRAVKMAATRAVK
jgi:hypothetical protein